MNFPDTLRYSEDHEWVRVEGGEAVVGITDFAQKELTDIVFVELPEIGRVVEKGGALAVVESVKAVSDVYSPVSGEVIAVNETLPDKPELVNTDPYGEGWMARVKLSKPEEIESLMTAAKYQEFIQEKG
jgi:glycine cleavage system H protein